jgi:hypothetical protein
VTVTLAAPSNLVYPQTAINATVGQAISTDTPTVTGTVTSYSVSPALPAGLSLSATSGAISGTPTAAAAQTTYTVTATNSTGSATATVQITVQIPAPSNLVYPQTAITAIVGQAISPDTPTVTGTVSSYGVSPALPAGLSLSTTTGVISGTPTATAAQATYTVTATNSTGFTTATLQIAVTIPPPSNLVYPQTTISVSLGQAVTPDIPTVAGTVSSFSVSPALPAGISLSTTTGVISGTPTATAAQTTYTVTATNPGGNTTATLTIASLQAKNVLLELGHASAISDIRFESGRVLSVDAAGHWVLWNYASAAILASGDLSAGGNLYSPQSPIDMAGPTVVDGVANGLEIRAQSDGHLLSTIAYPGLNIVPPGGTPPSSVNGSWWKLASDGSYICIGSNSGLSIYTLAGQIAASKSGDYSKANSFAAPGQVLVALGPAGQDVIEAISATDGTSTISPQFSGQFSSWFVDGGKFLTTLSTTVWVYSNTGVQQAIVQLPAITDLTGQGNWIWTYGTSSPADTTVNIYAIGSETPTLSFNGGDEPTFLTSGTTFASAVGPNQISVVDLSGSTPTQTNYTLPMAGGYAFAASSSSQWVVGNVNGLILDGASLSGTPRYFGQGRAWSIAGSSGSVAISTEIGTISVFDPYPATLQETIDFSSGKLSLSSDGSVLGAFANVSDGGTDRTLNFYSLPSGNVIKSFPYTASYTTSSTLLADFTLSASGGTIGQVTEMGTASSWNATTAARQVTPIAGTPVIWSDTGSFNQLTGYPNPIFLSPDGTLIAAYNAAQSSTSVTNIFKNGTLVTAVPGAAVGWIDNNRLLVNQYGPTKYQGAGPYLGCTIYSSTGAALATPPLPELQSIQTVNSDSVYDPTDSANYPHNAIYSLTTGQPTWTGSFPESGPGLLSGVGAVSGAYVVYASGHSVVVEAY